MARGRRGDIRGGVGEERGRDALGFEWHGQEVVLLWIVRRREIVRWLAFGRTRMKGVAIVENAESIGGSGRRRRCGTDHSTVE